MSYRQPRSDFTPVSGLIASSSHGPYRSTFSHRALNSIDSSEIHSADNQQSERLFPFCWCCFVSFCFLFVCLFVCFIIVWFKVSLHPELAYFSVFEAIKMSTKQLRLSMRRCRTCLSFLLSWFSLQIAEPVLPYALAFAAGAMVYVVVDDIIPEAQTR